MTARFLSTIIPLALLLLVGAVGRAQLLTNSHVEALQGALAPGAGTLRWTEVGTSSIADDGEIMFRGFLNNTTGVQQIGIWRGSAGNYSLMVRTTDSAPGAGTGVTFDEPFAPPRRAASAPKPIAFQARLITPDSTKVESLWSFPNGTLEKIAVEREAEPGGQTFLALQTDAFFGADDGSVAFAGKAGATGDIYGPATIWLWTRSSSVVSVVAKEGQPVPDVAGATWNGLSLSALSGGANPRIYFFGNMNDPNPNGPGGGLYSAALGQPAQVYVRYSDEAATQVPGAIFNSIQAFDVNGAGDVAFKAQLRAKDPFAVPHPVDDTNDQAIYLNRAMILRKGSPDLVSGYTFTGFEDLVINNAGQLAFRAGINGNDDNICRRDAAGVTIIASVGQNAPGTPDGVTFTSFGLITEDRLKMNDRGQVLFFAHTSDGKSGLWCNDPDGTLQLVVRPGAQIQVAPGDVRTVKLFSFVYDRTNGRGSGGHDGRAKIINDSGQIVFQVTFTDNKSAVIATGPSSAQPPTPSANSSGNHKQSVASNDPVNTRAGELVASKVDLNLRGPMPLMFARYYAAQLATDGNLTSALGANWLTNFDAKLTTTTDTATVVMTDGRVLSFTKTNNAWLLASPLDLPFQIVQAGAGFVLGDPRSQRMWTFDAAGKLAKVEDGRGNAHTLNRDANGQLTSVDDGLGRTLSFAYNAGGKLTSVGDGTRTVQYAYDANGNLAIVTDPLNQTTTYAYAPGGLMTSTTRPRGNTPITQTFASGKVATQVEHPASGDQATSFAYNANAHTTTITQPTGKSRTHTYTATGELSVFTDEEGLSVALGADATGRRSMVTDRVGRMTTIAYDPPSGKPASITAPDGTTTTLSYAPRVLAGITFYDLVKITFPDGTSRSFTYDAKGNLLMATDQLAEKSSFTYDAHGRVLTATNSTGGVATFTYDAKENLATSKDSDVGIGMTTYTHDGFSRLTRLTHPDGTHLDIAYDDADRVSAITDERGNAYADSYDVNDNVTAVLDPASKTTSFAYDALDRVTQITDRLGNASSRIFDTRDWMAGMTDENNNTVTMSRDTRQRLASVTNAGNATWSLGYNDEAELTSSTDPLGHGSSFVRNMRGRVVAASDALGNTWQLQRDTLQRVTQMIDPIGRAVGLSYDKRGLLVGASRDGIGAAGYTRDAAGRLVKITDPNNGAWSYVYSPVGRLTSSKDPLERTTSFDYDARGRLQTLTLPEGGTCAIARNEASDVTQLAYSAGPTLDFTYDTLRRLTGATGVILTRDAEGRITNSQQDGVNFSATYDPAGRLTSVGYSDGALVVTYAYDSRDRLITVTDNASGAANSVGFTYDDANRMTGLTRSNGVNATFTYDNADRLTRIQDGTILDLKYTLNADGDIRATDFTAPLVPSVTAEAKTFTFDAASQVTAAGYTYDARGRLTAMPGHTFVWDGASRLVSLDGTTLGYDGFGDMTARGTTRNFYHHAIAMHPVVAESTGGPTSRYYVWTPGGTLLWSVEGSDVRFYHFDRLGSTLALTDGAHQVTDAYAYSPYGEPLGHTGTSTQPFTFVGALGLRTEGAFYQMRARYYDPVTARFLSPDPAGPRLTDVRTLDPYQYALGNPSRYVDPSGTLELHTAKDPLTEKAWDKYEAPWSGNAAARFLADVFLGVEVVDVVTGEAEERAREKRRGQEALQAALDYRYGIKTAAPIPTLPSAELFGAATYADTHVQSGFGWGRTVKAGKEMVAGALAATGAGTSTNYDDFGTIEEIEVSNAAARRVAQMALGVDIDTKFPRWERAQPLIELDVGASIKDRLWFWGAAARNSIESYGVERYGDTKVTAPIPPTEEAFDPAGPKSVLDLM